MYCVRCIDDSCQCDPLKDNAWIGYKIVVGYTGLTYTTKFPK